MSSIEIKNFGPISEAEVDIKKVTVFVGNQGSGKSTIAKLISTFTWIEKALVREDYDAKWFERKNKFKNQFLPYHRLESYLNADTYIRYKGESYHIAYEKDFMRITQVTEKKAYQLPQIMYVPAERSFLTYIKGAKELKLSSDSLQEFSAEYNNAKDSMKGTMALPINGTGIEYDKLNDTLNLKGENYKIKITEASSGFQSLVPLYLVSEFLSDSVKKQSENKEPMSSDEKNRFKKGVQEIWANENLTDEQKRLALSTLSARFNKAAFINIVEEPEQNLFPSSQWEMLQSLLKFNNMNDDNKLILTTHSPYLVSFISIAIQANYLKDKIKSSSELMKKMEEIVSEKSLISALDVAIYQLYEDSGITHKLPNYEGIPSDKNFLNLSLRDGNKMFDKLLEIEQEL